MILDEKQRAEYRLALDECLEALTAQIEKMQDLRETLRPLQRLFREPEFLIDPNRKEVLFFLSLVQEGLSRGEGEYLVNELNDETSRTIDRVEHMTEQLVEQGISGGGGQFHEDVRRRSR